MATHVFQHVQAECRREIALLACVVDLRDQVRHRRSLAMSDFFQLTPEGIFQADAGLVSTNDDGAFDNRRFHWAPLCSPRSSYTDSAPLERVRLLTIQSYCASVKPYACRKHDNDYNQSDEDARESQEGHFCVLNKKRPARRFQLRAEGGLRRKGSRR